MEAAAEKSWSATVQIFRHGPIIIYTRLPAGGTYYPICMSPTNSECLISISDAFSAFVYGYPSSCPCAHCTPNKSVPTLRYTRRHGPVYTGHACRHLPSAVPWISEDHLLWLIKLLVKKIGVKSTGHFKTKSFSLYFDLSYLLDTICFEKASFFESVQYPICNDDYPNDYPD